MAVEEYVKACQDIFQSGLVMEDIIKRHIQRQIMISECLPDSASFFFVVEPVTNKYHFMGQQQESITGYTNEEVIRRGLEFFFNSLHPEEVNILLEEIYPEIASTLDSVSRKTDVKKTVTQFNYRFKDKSSKYINLMEQLYVLETDQDGKPALFLGNIITLENTEVIPLRLSVKIMDINDSLKTVLSNAYNTKKSVFENITAREMDIVRLLAFGKTSENIGKELCISKHTVDTHRRNILKKLHCQSAVDVTRLAFQNGLI
ncbi:LuxR C-terminal-related transcriptional regulator [Desulforhopalus sp. IMCC35007]|uniref:LuxR C-terminal-related transcriptional regulator n=1 Tax=Desulforhopalus sp. IMCC35007 TaxID=2569543 RepID=UPI0010AE4FFC|nr:LuxR C-terminal-related transcriptional regulator [Desulforhopalus sp. IMCC35007]TKB05862.1 hypothetical protein FCL48_23355 [Desulforhopalus sp. IMCC35007]